MEVQNHNDQQPQELHATHGNFNIQIIHEILHTNHCRYIQELSKDTALRWTCTCITDFKKCKIKTIILVILIDKGVNGMSSICCKTSQTPNKTNGNNNSEAAFPARSAIHTRSTWEVNFGKFINLAPCLASFVRDK